MYPPWINAPGGADGYAGRTDLGGGTDGEADKEETDFNGETEGVAAVSTTFLLETTDITRSNAGPARRSEGACFAVEPFSTTLQTRHGDN
jgi:hypothetical protein